MANSPSESIAAEVRAEMARQRRTSTDIAAEIGMSLTTFSRKLRGDYPFDVTELGRIAEALGVSPMAFWKIDEVAS